MIERFDVKRKTTRASWAALAVAMTLATMPACLTAQISLGTVVDLAQRNSSTVKLAEADKKKAEAALGETKDAYIPSLQVGSTVGYSKGFPTGQPSIANAAMQSLVLSFSQRQYIRSARAGFQAASLGLKDAREQVALDASIAYIELDTVTREMEVISQQESYANRLVLIEQERSEAGVDPLSEVLRAQLMAAELKLKRIHLNSRTGTLAKQLSVLTGLPLSSLIPDHTSIPEIPTIKADEPARTLVGVASAQALAHSKQLQTSGDDLARRRPSIGFGAQYNLDSDKLNSYSTYYNHFTPNNISFGISFQIPLFDMVQRAKAKQTAAEALRATVEAEQAQRQNDVQIAELTGSLRELDAQAEIATLKQEIAHEQLQAVLTQLEVGNGSGAGAGSQTQMSPKAEQLARIEERQKYQDALDTGLDLSKTRLGLLRALGHMEDWLNELHGR